MSIGECAHCDRDLDIDDAVEICERCSNKLLKYDSLLAENERLKAALSEHEGTLGLVEADRNYLRDEFKAMQAEASRLRAALSELREVAEATLSIFANYYGLHADDSQALSSLRAAVAKADATEAEMNLAISAPALLAENERLRAALAASTPPAGEKEDGE